MIDESGIEERSSKTHPLLRCIILVYDFLRLLLLVRMTGTFSPSFGEPGDSVLPYVALMSPHALFPLASFFLWVNPRAYSSYIPLYITGKIIGIGAFAGWMVLFRNSIIASIGMDIQSAAETLGLTLLLLFADIVTILGSCFIVRTLNQNRKNVRTSPDGGM